MSFVNIKRKSYHPPKKRVPRKKAWDDTVNDLTAYKATPEEIAYRRASHRSKHAVSTHINRGPGSAHKGKRTSPFKNAAQARKLAIMKEVLYDQRQLQEVLEKSDTMMAVVKDLFGDDPRRFAGFPAVTAAPNAEKEDVASSLIKLPPDMKTRSEFLSESMMDGSALNDLQSDSEEDSPQQPLRYQPKMNMQRFQQFLELEEKNNTLSTISGQAGLSHLGQGLTSHLNTNAQSSQLPDNTNLSRLTASQDGMMTPTKNDPNESIEILRPPKSAINNTDKVNKTKRRIPKPQPEERSANFSLTDLRKVLEGLEDEIADYEKQSGRCPPAERQRQESFSGYTLALVDSVTKLTRYLKECDIRLQAEMTIREQLTQDVIQCKALIDALTSDIITTQEEFHNLASEFHRYKTEARGEIQRQKGVPAEAQDDSQPVPSENPAEPAITPPKSCLQMEDLESVLHLPMPFGDHMKPVPAAVMLSPPVRRSRVTESDSQGQDEKRQGSLMEFPDIPSSADGSSLSLQEDFASLPHTFTSQAGRINSYAAGQQSSKPSAQHSTQQTVTVPNYSITQRQPAVPVPLNSVSVPRPTPLVQTNVRLPDPTESNRQTKDSGPLPQSFAEKHLPISLTARDKPKTLHDPGNTGNSGHASQSDTGMSAPDREFLAFQIAELNKQHAEAQMRLNGLMSRQNNTSCDERPVSSEEVARQQQQYWDRERQEVIENQGHLQQQQLQHDQQQKLIDMVMQQQQKIHQQQMLQKKQQNAHDQLMSQGQGHGPQMTLGQHSTQINQQMSQNQGHQMRQSQNPPMQMDKGRSRSQGQSELPRPVMSQSTGNGGGGVRVSAEFPGYRHNQRQTGLPGYQISPNISPISQRSENYRAVYQSVDSQDTSISAPANRGITVSLPKVELDISEGSPSPKHLPQTAR